MKTSIRKQLIKVSLILLASLVTLVLIAIIGLVSFVDPNNFKPQISRLVSQYTGRQLVLAGAIQWSFFPWLGLQLTDVSLNNPPQFIKLHQLNLQIKLWPLLRKQLEVSKLQCEDLELYLLKDKQGNGNWNFGYKPSTATRPTDSTSVPWQSLALLIAGLDIQRGHITYQDQQAGERYDIDNLYFKGGMISARHYFPVSLQFTLKADKPSLDIAVRLTSDISFDAATQSLRGDNFKFTALLKNSDYPRGLPINLQATIASNLDNETLAIDGLTAVIAAHRLTGHVKGKKVISSPLLSGQFTMPVLKLDRYLIEKIKFNLALKDKMLVLSPFTANLYQGYYQGNVQVDLAARQPRIKVNSTLTHLNLQTLFRDLATTTAIRAKGLADVQAQFQTAGADQATLLKNLKGHGAFKLTDGTIEGIDIAYWWAAGKALLKQQPLQRQDTRQTVFSALQGSFSVKQTIVTSNDLLIRSGRLAAHGHGSADLQHKRLNYQLKIQSLQANGRSEGSPLPISITGPFNQLIIRPIVEQFLHNFAKEKLRQTLGQLFGTDSTSIGVV